MLKALIVEPGSAAGLSKRDTDDRLGLASKDEARLQLAELVEEISKLHDRLYAEAARSVLLVVQGLDASGKDGTIRSVFTGLNPAGCRVVSFKAPTATELAHDYLWRVHAVCPQRGEIAIFNRSHYEDVATLGVKELAPKEVWKRRPHHIREFEKLLADEGTSVVKVFLHVSREEQGKRLRERLSDPEKQWKFRAGDLDDRARWDDFMAAYEDVITKTSTEWAPWYVVPADRNWVRNLAVARILLEALRKLDPKLPALQVDPKSITIE
jgi:PPK2 family polyphosphate:nucleotide phosphotransferase